MLLASLGFLSATMSALTANLTTVFGEKEFVGSTSHIAPCSSVHSTKAGLWPELRNHLIAQLHGFAPDVKRVPGQVLWGLVPESLQSHLVGGEVVPQWFPRSVSGSGCDPESQNLIAPPGLDDISHCQPEEGSSLFRLARKITVKQSP